MGDPYTETSKDGFLLLAVVSFTTGILLFKYIEALVCFNCLALIKKTKCTC